MTSVQMGQRLLHAYKHLGTAPQLTVKHADDVLVHKSLC